MVKPSHKSPPVSNIIGRVAAATPPDYSGSVLMSLLALRRGLIGPRWI